jgi:hypothetical protein
MLDRKTVGAIAASAVLATALLAAMPGRFAASAEEISKYDMTKYPDWRGQWLRLGGGAWDPNKPNGRAQQPPLTAEYMAVWEKNIALEAAGSQEYNPQARCLSGGMPRMMVVYEPMELVVTPQITYVLMEYMNPLRRIYTDGRDWPKAMEPTFAGYSIGHWEDSDNDGRFDTLIVETRGLRAPRVYDPSGIPFHDDNQTIVKERITLDKANPDIMSNELTTIDNALTRPWVVTRKYQRERNPTWFEFNCGEANPQITLGDQSYFLTPNGDLMPTRKNQPPPVIDLKYFPPSAK